MMIPKISIITPNYNYANYIGDTIQSLIAQDYENFEHIIVDDGSTDNSVEIIQKFINKHPGKIKLIRQENQGQTAAINVGLKQAVGDIIGWINSDDKYCANTFKIISDKFNEYPEVDAIFGDIIIIDSKDKLIKKKNYLNFDYNSGVFKGFGNLIPSNAIFWRADLMHNIALLDKNYRYAMDSEYWSRLLFNANIIHLKEYFAFFRWHNSSKTVLSHDKNKKDHDLASIENNKIFLNSYNNLSISKFIKPNYSFPIKLFYLIKRILLRLFFGHYF